MIEYLKIKNHKAIVSTKMVGIGRINVICGTNNSGKTAVLEALCKNECYSVGKNVEGIDWLINLFEHEANKYTDPSSDRAITWFSNYVNKLIQQNTIWFSDEQSEIISELRDAQKMDPYLGKFSKDIYDFSYVLNAFFEKTLNFFNPFLIPPKRQIEFETAIRLNQEIASSGSGILNKLFFLKNQDLESNDYKLYRTIYDTFTKITGSTFNVVPDLHNQIKLFYKTDNTWIPASDSGLGLYDVLIIITMLNVVDSNVFLIEEPENHLHAAFQKKMLSYFQTINTKLFIITTHSPVFLDMTNVDKIFFCSNNGEILLSDHTSKSKMIDALGYSVAENILADVIIMLEGPTDIPVIREMLSWLGINSTHNIKYWPLGGDIMGSLDMSIFAESKNVFILIDTDPKSSAQRTRLQRHCKKYDIHCWKLKRYALENYFPLKAIREAFPKQLPNKIRELSEEIKVDDQLGFTKNKTVKTKNAAIVKNMNISDIEGTDLYGFLYEIKNFLDLNTK